MSTLIFLLVANLIFRSGINRVNVTDISEPPPRQLYL